MLDNQSNWSQDSEHENLANKPITIQRTHICTERTRAFVCKREKERETMCERTKTTQYNSNTESAPMEISWNGHFHLALVYFKGSQKKPLATVQISKRYQI